MRHRREVAKRVWIRKRPVLLEAFLQVGPLHVMEPAGVSTVVPGEDAPLRVDLATKGVATPSEKIS
jgi:hypothetical protein